MVKKKIKGKLEQYSLTSEFKGGDSIIVILKDVKIEEENKTLDTVWFKVGKTFAKENVEIGSELILEGDLQKEIKRKITKSDKNGVHFIEVEDYSLKRAKVLEIKKNKKGECLKDFYKKKLKEKAFIDTKYKKIIS